MEQGPTAFGMSQSLLQLFSRKEAQKAQKKENLMKTRTISLFKGS